MHFLLDQPYESSGGTTLTYDLFRPDTNESLPLVVMLHGGGWISGDKTWGREEALWLAPQGYAVACIEYRLAPLYPFPAAVADAQAFVAHARARAAILAIRPDRIISFGNSAGGHLACMLGLCEPYLGEGELPARHTADAVIDICGITELRDPDACHFPISMTFLEQFMGGPYAENPDAYEQASPVGHVGSSPPPFVVIHGTEDEIVPIDQSERLVSALRAAGGDVSYYPLEGEMHSFTLEGWSKIRGIYTAFLTSLR